MAKRKNDTKITLRISTACEYGQAFTLVRASFDETFFIIDVLHLVCSAAPRTIIYNEDCPSVD